MAYGPYAVGRKDGVVVFVSLAAPGDLLKVKVTELFDRYMHAEIVEILRPSSQRRTPPCPVFGACGGCDWQHLAESSQLEQKRKIVQDILQKSLGDAGPDFERAPLEIFASPKSFHYRNRVQLKQRGGQLGYYKRATHEIVEINSCPLLETPLSEEISKLSKSLRKAPSGDSGVERIELSLMRDGSVQSSRAENPLLGEGFSQVNELVNQEILTTLKNWFSSENSFFLEEFYAGSGNFSFPLLESFPRMSLRAVEWHPKSVERAQKKLREAHISPKRARFFCASVESDLRRHAVNPDHVVFLDPPRSGAHEFVIRSLAFARPRRLIYLSCDPASLARDLKLLQKSSASPWRYVRAKAFDMFPQTHHVETLVELVP